MQYYYLFIDEENNIVKSISTFEKQEGIEITDKEYNNIKFFNKFNLETREFYDPKNQKPKEISRLEQIEQSIGVLAEQVAKNTLIGGNE